MHKGTKKIALTGKRGIGKFALVDSASFLCVNKRKWYLSKHGYPTTGIYNKETKKTRQMTLHRFIIGKAAREIDHVNQIKVDNRIANLREVSHSVNMLNRGAQSNTTTGIKGVYFDKSINRIKRWYTSLQVDGKTYQAGRFNTKKEALQARKELEKKYVTT